MFTARLEPAVPASEGPQTRVLPRKATAIGRTQLYFKRINCHISLPAELIYQEFSTEVFKQCFMQKFGFPADVLHRPTPRIKIDFLSRLPRWS